MLINGGFRCSVLFIEGFTPNSVGEITHYMKKVFHSIVRSYVVVSRMKAG